MGVLILVIFINIRDVLDEEIREGNIPENITMSTNLEKRLEMIVELNSELELSDIFNRVVKMFLRIGALKAAKQKPYVITVDMIEDSDCPWAKRENI